MATDYCSQSDIDENLRGLEIGADTSVTSTALKNMISQESQVIDQHIQGLNTIPVTDSDALLFLKKICIDLVIYRVTKILRPRNIEPIPKKATQDISHASAWHAAMKMLKDLKDGVTTLPNTIVASKTFVSSTLETEDFESVFERNVKQW